MALTVGYGVNYVKCMSYVNVNHRELSALVTGSTRQMCRVWRVLRPVSISVNFDFVGVLCPTLTSSPLNSIPVYDAFHDKHMAFWYTLIMFVIYEWCIVAQIMDLNYYPLGFELISIAHSKYFR